MNFCGIDFESTGFPATTCRITEMGAIPFRIEESEVIQSSMGVSALVWDPSYPPQNEIVIAVTGITDQMLKETGIPLVKAIGELLQVFNLVYWPDFFVCHNKSFDETLFKSEMKRSKEILLSQIPEADLQRLFDIPWICTLKDVKHPEKYKSKKLAHLALDYGCVVDPQELHRAAGDVALMIRMIAKGKFDLGQMASDSKIPNVVIRALVPSPFGKGSDGGVGKDKAKACGFGYGKPPGCDGPEIKSAWLKQVKENEVEKEKQALGYEVAIVHGV